MMRERVGATGDLLRRRARTREAGRSYRAARTIFSARESRRQSPDPTREAGLPARAASAVTPAPVHVEAARVAHATLAVLAAYFGLGLGLFGLGLLGLGLLGLGGCSREVPPHPGIDVEVREDGTTMLRLGGRRVRISRRVDVAINDVTAQPFDVRIERRRLRLVGSSLLIGDRDFGPVAPDATIVIEPERVLVDGEDRGSWAAVATDPDEKDDEDTDAGANTEGSATQEQD